MHERLSYMVDYYNLTPKKMDEIISKRENMIKNIEQRVKEKKFVLIAEIGVNYYDIAKEKRLWQLHISCLR